MHGDRLRAELVLGAVALGWGFSFLVVKDVLAHVSPHALVTLRFGLAAVTLAALAGRSLGRIDAATLRGGLLAGAALWTGFVFQTLGLVETTPARSGFLTALYVPLTPLLALLLLRQSVRRMEGLAALVAFAGLGLLSPPQGPGAFSRGDLYTLCGAFGFAAHILVLDRVARKGGARALGVLQVGACGALSLPFALAGPRPEVTSGVVLAVLYLGLVCSAFAYAAQPWAQRHTSPSRVAVILALEAVFAAILSVGLGAERLGPREWLGGGLVVAAVVIGQRGARRVG